MMQVARNLTDGFNGALAGKSYLIVDRDAQYSAQFRRLIAECRTAVIRPPTRMRSIKQECLDRIIFVGQASLRGAITDLSAPSS